MELWKRQPCEKLISTDVSFRYLDVRRLEWRPYVTIGYTYLSITVDGEAEGHQDGLLAVGPGGGEQACVS